MDRSIADKVMVMVSEEGSIRSTYLPIDRSILLASCCGEEVPEEGGGNTPHRQAKDGARVFLPRKVAEHWFRITPQLFYRGGFLWLVVRRISIRFDLQPISLFGPALDSLGFFVPKG
jgi:hypothetical protein